MNLELVLERAKQEREELIERCNKLFRFIHCDEYAELDMDDRNSLKRQYGLMTEYCYELNGRIQRMRRKLENKKLINSCDKSEGYNEDCAKPQRH